MRQTLAQVDRLIDIDDPILLEGETGTGKGLLARSIHALGPRASAPFVALNCAALPETLLESELFGRVRGAYTGADTDRPGLFEAAHRGTLFLDEIEAMSEAMQKMLLRTLDERKVRRVGALAETPIDVRIIAATNQPLQARVAEGRFRQDTYYRLSTFCLRLPPLRERREDIRELAEHFLLEVARETRGPKPELSAPVLELLLAYPWPGNVRELKNEVRRLVVSSGAVLEPRDLAAPIRDFAVALPLHPARGAYRERLAAFEKRLIQEALEAHGWNLSATSRALETNRSTLRKRMKELSIAPSRLTPE
jgi:transcriptional regulator with PAS, ATPase and Fis domain